MIDKRKQSVNRGIKEVHIETEILVWLASKKIFAWKVKTTGTYDPKIKCFRSTPWYYRKGVPDIHGFIKKVPFVVEVKSATGTLSEAQIEFAHDWANACDGIYILARSLEDVQRAFKESGINT